MLTRSLVRSCTRLGRVAARPPPASASVTLQGHDGVECGEDGLDVLVVLRAHGDHEERVVKRFDAASSL